jgi:hypothetical protein
MGKMKEHVMRLEEHFWHLAAQTVSGCENVEDYLSEMSEYKQFMPLLDDDEFTELVVDSFNHYWEEKGHA